METNKLSLLSMPDVCFPGWFSVNDFMMMSQTCFTFFSFPFVFIKRLLDFFCNIE